MNDWTRRILGIGLLSLFVLGAACTAAPAANTGGDGGSGGIGGSGGGTGGTGTGGTGTGGTGGTGTGGTGGTGTGGTGGTGTGGTGGTGTGGTGGTGTGGTGGTVVQDGLMVYGFNAEAIPRGATYADITANGIPPFSYSRHSLTLKNEGTEVVTVLGFTVTPIGATLPTEWRVVDPDVSAPTEIATIEVALAPTESYDFDLYFYPFESGPRSATIEISLGSGGSYSFVTDGRGRDNALFSPDVEASHEGIYGSPGGDVLVGGLAMDPAGNTYMNLNANEWLDGFSEDLVLTRINADGTLAWAMEWHEDFEQLSPDPGQNGESGGSADSISYSDGAIYVVGHRSQSAFNSTFQTLVMKVDAATGALLWARGWVPAGTEIPDIAAESSEGYAIDATLADRVIVAGAANGMVTVIALSKADGALLYDRQVDVAVGSNDRAHALAVHTDGSGYVGGLTNGRGLLVRLTGLDGNAPAISWSQELSMGIGSNVNSLAIDAASGDVFASLDRRGATTFFSAARINAAGATVWSKTWDAQNNGDNNNTYVVRTDGTRVVVGGRIAFTPFDTQYAEGFLLALNAADGAYDFSSFYYTGKGAEEMVEHRVKGVAFDGTKLRVATQSYTNGLDFDHYWGFWYQAPDFTLELPPGDGSERFVDYTLQTTDKTATSTITTPAASSAFLIDASTFWVAPPPSAVYSPARTREGPGGDGTLLYQIVDLK